MIRQSIPSVNPRPVLQYGGEYAITGHPQTPPVVPQHSVAPPTSTIVATPTVSVAPPSTTLSATQAQTSVVQAVPMHESMRRYIVNGTSQFFGVNGSDDNEKVWIERRRRLAIKLFGGVKDAFQVDGSSGNASGNPAYEDSLVRNEII